MNVSQGICDIQKLKKYILKIDLLNYLLIQLFLCVVHRLMMSQNPHKNRSLGLDDRN